MPAERGTRSKTRSENKEIEDQDKEKGTHSCPSSLLANGALMTAPTVPPLMLSGFNIVVATSADCSLFCGCNLELIDSVVDVASLANESEVDVGGSAATVVLVVDFVTPVVDINACVGIGALLLLLLLLLLLVVGALAVVCSSAGLSRAGRWGSANVSN